MCCQVAEHLVHHEACLEDNLVGGAQAALKQLLGPGKGGIMFCWISL